MTPTRKLNWFSKNEWRPDDIATVRQLVLDRWAKSYRGQDNAPAAAAPQAKKQKVCYCVTGT